MVSKKEIETRAENAKDTFLKYDIKIQLLISALLGLFSSILLRMAKSLVLFGLIVICLILINCGLKKEKLMAKYQKIKEAAQRNDVTNSVS
ncbi:unnamed protein product [Gordionus sp. m RMFG-2023]